MFRKPTIEQLGEFIAPTFKALIDGAKYVDGRLHEIIDDVRPDVIVEDNVVSFPALPASGVPWVRIVSCNPAELKDSDVPPTFSGYPAGDRTDWAAYREEQRRTHAPLHADFDAFCRDCGAPGLPELELVHTSPWLNLYLYPDEVDYARADPLGDRWHNLLASARDTDAAWEPPPSIAERAGPLLYLSLGSLGSGDVELMRTLIGSLADSRYDNAQRMHETGFGIRLDTYRHAPEELTRAVERLLADAPLHDRLAALSARLAATPGTVAAAGLIERLAGDAPRGHQ